MENTLSATVYKYLSTPFAQRTVFRSSSILIYCKFLALLYNKIEKLGYGCFRTATNSFF